MIKKKVYIVIISTMFLTLCLSGCSEKLKSGEVYEKQFTQAHTSVVMIPFAISNGKTTTINMIPFVYYYADDYAVSIKANDGSGKTATYHVTKEVYDTVTIGCEFKWDSESCFDNALYTRERQYETED